MPVHQQRTSCILGVMVQRASSELASQCSGSRTYSPRPGVPDAPTTSTLTSYRTSAQMLMARSRSYAAPTCILSG